MNNKLGCLSPLALVSFFLAVLALLVAEILNGNAMFSPGALHAAHAEIGDDCGQCHAPFWASERMTERCLVCHTKIQAELGDSSTLHGALVKGANSTCQACHTEHAGPSAALTVMDTAAFPHEVTGFALTAHRNRSPGIPFACNDCHTQSLARFDQQTCLECHQKLDSAWMTTHLADFGANCLACHDGHDRFGQFDHAQTGFILTGKHQNTACSACHQNAHTLNDLAGLSPTCESCHLKDDAHQGRFGTNCGVCHSPEGWKPAQFDHNLAAFKLEGKHAAVACENCHQNGQYKGTPQDCYSCHKANDAHNGQLGTACETCHNPSSWENVTFDHNLSRFKLEGKHVSVKCESCHQNKQFKGTPTTCYACHKKDDAHNGQFGMACEVCHTPTDWKNATFDHNLSRFPLTGAHVTVKCESCHQNRVFKGTPTECAACHREPAYHAGMFPGQACSQCHTTTAWRPAQYTGPHTFPMNHGQEGGRVNTCADCHQPNLTTWTCYTCHNQAEVTRKHLKKGIANFSDCMRCHPTGQEDEGEDDDD